MRKWKEMIRMSFMFYMDSHDLRFLDVMKWAFHSHPLHTSSIYAFWKHLLSVCYVCICTPKTGNKTWGLQKLVLILQIYSPIKQNVLCTVTGSQVHWLSMCHHVTDGESCLETSWSSFLPGAYGSFISHLFFIKAPRISQLLCKDCLGGETNEIVSTNELNTLALPCRYWTKHV